MKTATQYQKYHYARKLLKVGLQLDLDNDCMILENTLYDIIRHIKNVLKMSDELVMEEAELRNDIRKVILSQDGIGDSDCEDDGEMDNTDDLIELLLDTLLDDMDFSTLKYFDGEAVETKGTLLRNVTAKQGQKAYAEIANLLKVHPKKTLQRIAKRIAARKILRFMIRHMSTSTSNNIETKEEKLLSESTTVDFTSCTSVLVELLNNRQVGDCLDSRATLVILTTNSVMNDISELGKVSKHSIAKFRQKLMEEQSRNGRVLLTPDMERLLVTSTQ
jgi:hypothetical protein